MTLVETEGKENVAPLVEPVQEAEPPFVKEDMINDLAESEKRGMLEESKTSESDDLNLHLSEDDLSSPSHCKESIGDAGSGLADSSKEVTESSQIKQGDEINPKILFVDEESKNVEPDLVLKLKTEYKDTTSVPLSLPSDISTPTEEDSFKREVKQEILHDALDTEIGPVSPTHTENLKEELMTIEESNIDVEAHLKQEIIKVEQLEEITETCPEEDTCLKIDSVCSQEKSSTNELPLKTLDNGQVDETMSNASTEPLEINISREEELVENAFEEEQVVRDSQGTGNSGDVPQAMETSDTMESPEQVLAATETSEKTESCENATEAMETSEKTESCEDVPEPMETVEESEVVEAVSKIVEEMTEPSEVIKRVNEESADATKSENSIGTSVEVKKVEAVAKKQKLSEVKEAAQEVNITTVSSSTQIENDHIDKEIDKDSVESTTAATSSDSAFEEDNSSENSIASSVKRRAETSKGSKVKRAKRSEDSGATSDSKKETKSNEKEEDTPADKSNTDRKFFEKYPSSVFDNLTRHKLEDLIMLHFVDFFANRGPHGEMRQKLVALEEEHDRLVRLTASLKKQLSDARHVVKRLVEDRKNAKGREHMMMPVKVTRSVGLQVCTVGSLYIRPRTEFMKANLEKGGVIDLDPPKKKNPPVTPTKPVPVNNPPPMRGPSSESGATQGPRSTVQSVGRPAAPVAQPNNNSPAVVKVGNQQQQTQKAKPPVPVPTGTPTFPPPSNVQANTTTASPNNTMNGSKVRHFLITSRPVGVPSTQTAATTPTTTATVAKPSPVNQPEPVNAAQTNTSMEVIDLTDKDEKTPTRGGRGMKTVPGIVSSTPKTSIEPKVGNQKGVSPGRRTDETDGAMGTVANDKAKLPPLPPAPKYAMPSPPRPYLRICKSNAGIMLSWNFGSLKVPTKIASFQLFAYQERADGSAPRVWNKVGEVKALPLPMACTLTQFVEGHKYHFAVRAIDIHERVGEFSSPGSIVLTLTSES